MNHKDKKPPIVFYLVFKDHRSGGTIISRNAWPGICPDYYEAYGWAGNRLGFFGYVRKCIRTLKQNPNYTYLGHTDQAAYDRQMSNRVLDSSALVAPH